MGKIKKDEKREDRIEMVVVVDAHNEEERAMAWYYYLQDNIMFPFDAICIEELKISPLKKDEKVVVADIASEEDCLKRILVEIEWEDKFFLVPLEQLEPLDVDDETLEVIEDWKYWVDRGYKF